MRLSDTLRKAAARFAEYRRTHIEMYERHLILLEPWTHDILHWGLDGTLHGSVAPGGARPPVTRGGWCPCHHLDATVGGEPDVPGLPDRCER